jgi:hypothetical protein
MKLAARKLAIIHIVIALSAIQFENSYAYLDPGTGSYLIQVLIGVILGGLYALKIFWTKIKLFFKKFSK